VKRQGQHEKGKNSKSAIGSSLPFFRAKQAMNKPYQNVVTDVSEQIDQVEELIQGKQL